MLVDIAYWGKLRLSGRVFETRVVNGRREGVSPDLYAEHEPMFRVQLVDDDILTSDRIFQIVRRAIAAFRLRSPCDEGQA